MIPTVQKADSAILSPLGLADADAYDRFVAQHPDSLLYASSRYRRFLEELLDCQSEYWIAREAGAITGVLPLMRRSGVWGDVLNSLPYFGSNGGALANSRHAERALLRKFNDLSAAPTTLASTWISNPVTHADVVPNHDLVDERLSQFTALTADPDELLSRIDGSARRNIKKARAEGVAVRIDDDAFEFLAQTHNDNMVRIGGRPKSSRFFECVPRHFRPGDDYKIYVAEVGGVRCAALLLFYFNQTVEYFTPVTVEEMRGAQPMALILFDAMLEAAAAGYRRWNWGGTWLTQTGVRRFKEKWGATEGRYRYFTKLNDKNVLRQSPAALSKAYPDFFVVPYVALEEA